MVLATPADEVPTSTVVLVEASGNATDTAVSPTKTETTAKATTTFQEQEANTKQVEAGPSPVTVVVGTAAKLHHPMILPPTKQDDRKIFVGGLPPDGTFLLCRLSPRVVMITQFLHSFTRSNSQGGR